MNLPHTMLSDEDWVFERLRAFHRDRTEKMATEMPPKEDSPGMIVLHLIPQSSSSGRARFEGSELRQHSTALGPLGGNGSSTLCRFNATGWLMPDGRQERRAYSQLFRDGRLEGAMMGACCQQHRLKIVNDKRCEEAVLRVVSSYLEFCKAADLPPPIWLFSSLVECGGARFKVDPRFGDLGEHALDGQIVSLPEMVISSLDIEVPKALRPWCDALWQTGGVERSLNYDKDGARKVREGW